MRRFRLATLVLAGAGALAGAFGFAVGAWYDGRLTLREPPPVPDVSLPRFRPLRENHPPGTLVLDPLEARGTMNELVPLDAGGARLPNYAGVFENLVFGQPRPRRITLLTRGTPSPHGYPLVRVALESPAGDRLFHQDFQVFDERWASYDVDVPPLAGPVTLRVFFLRGVFEGRGDTLDLREIAVEDARLAEDPPARADIRAITDPMIRRHRMGRLVVLAEPGTEVRIRQTGHAFEFGCVLERRLFQDDDIRPADRARHDEMFTRLFNSVTVAGFYWSADEKRRGEPDYETADAMIRWARERGLHVRGHPLFWGADIQGRIPDWQKDLERNVLRQVIRRRGRQVASRYAGRVREWDFNNEMVHHQYYRTRLFDVAWDMSMSIRAGDPEAALYLNDFNLITLGALDDYTDLLDELLAKHIPIGGIGVQGRSYGRVYHGHVFEALDRLGEYGLPVKISEAGPSIADVDRRAEVLDELLRLYFAHPAVDGITIWGFWGGVMWDEQAGAMWDENWNSLPTGKVLTNLLENEWRTTWRGTADAEGRVTIPAFFGRYAVTAHGETRDVELPEDPGKVTADFTRPAAQQ
ncbi:MAG: endo-1,4-beta-xylanase [Phycisphaeraceae bacterium]